MILNGHTHQTYAYDVTGTRKVVQAKSYGEKVGQIDLTVTNGQVTAATATTVDVTTQEAAPGSNATVDAVRAIVDTALAESKVIGNQPVGTITADITRAKSGGTYGPNGYTGGSNEERGEESSLGNLVADALKDTPIAAMGAKKPDLGIVNPGGLRADLLYKGDPASNPANTDGVVTFEEANSVLPFVNNINYVDLTGAQLKAVLEEQWQLDKDGKVPSRAFLHLGLSKNVRTTLNPARPRGERVTGLWVNGAPVDPAKTYTVSTFSFLAQGGDNFRSFAKGKVVDTGAIDRDLWIDGYFKNGQAKSPDFAKRQVYSDTTGWLVGGVPTKFSVTKLDMMSNGAPANTSLEGVLSRPNKTTAKLGPWPVTAGAATVTVDLPAPTPVGSKVDFTAKPSGTAFEVLAGPSLSAVKVTKRAVVRKNRVRYDLTVTGAGGKPVNDGHVQAFTGKAKAISGKIAVRDGKAVVRIEPFRWTGTRKFRFSYSGGSILSAVTVPESVRVVRAKPRMKLRVRPSNRITPRERAAVVVRMRMKGQRPVRGKVVVRVAGERYVAKLKKRGKVRIPLDRIRSTGKKKVVVVYRKTRLNKKVRKVRWITVRRR